MVSPRSLRNVILSISWYPQLKTNHFHHYQDIAIHNINSLVSLQEVGTWTDKSSKFIPSVNMYITFIWQLYQNVMIHNAQIIISLLVQCWHLNKHKVHPFNLRLNKWIWAWIYTTSTFTRTLWCITLNSLVYLQNVNTCSHVDEHEVYSKSMNIYLIDNWIFTYLHSFLKVMYKFNNLCIMNICENISGRYLFSL